MKERRFVATVLRDGVLIVRPCFDLALRVSLLDGSSGINCSGCVQTIRNPKFRNLVVTDERRREERASVLVEVLWEGKTGHYDARTSDLSMGGCFVDTPGRVMAGERFTFKLRMPGEDWIEVEGTVTYAYTNVGFGVQFTNISEVNRKKLEKLVKRETNKGDKHV